MKRAAGLLLAALLCASLGTSTTYYALEVHGVSRIYAIDPPIRKGRVYLFHRFPDGVYMSLAATEVEGVVSLTEPPPPAERLAPGQSVYVGPPLPGSGFASAPVPPPTAAPADTTYVDSGYGYSDYSWGGGGYVPPPRPGPVPPTRIGPNGYPILAPPGSPGSRPLPIGPNGFPILAPPPPSVSPRR